MKVLVGFASKYGSTREIAERIGDVLRQQGQSVDVRPVDSANDLSAYDAFVIGSAVYYGSWLKQASEFVRTNRALLASKPVWLFSSGPIGASGTELGGADLLDAAEPKQIAEFRQTLPFRGHRVFYGKLDRSKLKFVDLVVASIPAFPGSEGDFRDWADIESWAASIAQELAQVPAAHR